MCIPEQPAPPSAWTECHRGIFEIDDPLNAYAYQPTLTCQPLGGRLWTISDGIYRTVFCEGDKGLIAFDTFYSPGAAVAYRKALNRVFPEKQVHTVVYSHDHLDHAGFAADLAPRADVLAHAECAAVVEARGSDGQTPPTAVFDEDRIEYRIDGVRFELHNPGPTHGNGNVAAHFPEERALFMVDTVIPGVGYTFFPDWHVSGYLRNMRGLLQEVGEWDTFVPGHFWVTDRPGAEANLSFFDDVLLAAAEALLEGVDPDDFLGCHRYAEERLGPRHGRLYRFHEYAGMNLMRMMLHLRQGGWGLEDARPDELAGSSGSGGAATGSRALELAAELDQRRQRDGSPGVATGSIEMVEVAAGISAVSADDRYALCWGAPEGPVCVGTLGTPAGARSLAGEVKALADADPVVVLATDHIDQSGFASELSPARLLAHELTVRALEGKLGHGLPAPVEPVSGDQGPIEIQGSSVDLIYPGPTAGTGTLAVHLPEASVLYVVGPRPDARYGLIADVHLAGATKRWRRLLELEPDAVVFARGGVGTAADLQRACDYIDGLSWATQKAFADGVAIWDVRAMEEYARELLRGDFGDLEGFDEHIGISAIRVVHHFLMGGWGLEDAYSGVQD